MEVEEIQVAADGQNSGQVDDRPGAGVTGA